MCVPSVTLTLGTSRQPPGDAVSSSQQASLLVTRRLVQCPVPGLCCQQRGLCSEMSARPDPEGSLSLLLISMFRRLCV